MTDYTSEQLKLPDFKISMADDVVRGIYILFKGDVPVYVGKSINIRHRVHTHRITYDFDSYTFIPYGEGENLDHWEAAYTAHYRPVYNFRENGNATNPECGSHMSILTIDGKVVYERIAEKRITSLAA